MRAACRDYFSSCRYFDAIDAMMPAFAATSFDCCLLLPPLLPPLSGYFRCLSPCHDAAPCHAFHAII
jgi:hypothetical protein